jgi:Ser/Thr protein kinase RdoA (MazF antagonist)
MRFVLKFQQKIQAIQKLKVCHGDLHMENVLIELGENQNNFYDPQFELKIIDYGNGFLMREGEVVSE